MKNKDLVESGIESFEDIDVFIKYIDLTINLYQKYGDELLDDEYLEAIQDYDGLVRLIELLDKADKLNIDELTSLKDILIQKKKNRQLYININDVNRDEFVDQIKSKVDKEFDFETTKVEQNTQLGLEVQIGDHRYKRNLENDIEALLSS